MRGATKPSPFPWRSRLVYWPQYAVVLTNRQIPPDAVFRLFCPLGPVLIAPGENRLPVTVMTTYQQCSPAKHQAGGIPPCPDGRMPPLPRGNYEAVLIGSLPVPAPAPVAVTLSAASG